MKIKCPKCGSKFSMFNGKLNHYDSNSQKVNRLYIGKDFIDCPACGVKLRESDTSEWIRKFWLLLLPLFLGNSIAYSFSDPSSVFSKVSHTIQGPFFLLTLIVATLVIVKSVYEVDE